MATVEAAERNYRLQQALGAVTANSAGRLWQRMGDDFDASWRQILPALLTVVSEAQLAAASTANRYIASSIYDTDQVDLPVGALVPSAFAGTAADGRSLSGLLEGAVTQTKQAVGGGESVAGALAVGGRWLTMTVLTAVADANREAAGAAIAMRPAIGGYVRMLNPPSCNRCIILAGKFFRWNQGFQRHPRCDCRHIPASENVADSLSTDPYAAFRSMSTVEQDKAFGRLNARAIRDGADIYRVTNISQRGLATAKSAARFGTPSRLTVDDIYRTAGSRRNAIRMLTDQGYITGPQVAGGNILGNIDPSRKILANGPGRGTYRIGGVDYETARSKRYRAALSGERGQLDRATMTAAERRIYDAAYRADWANRGYWPGSIGANSADRGLKLRPITADERDLVGLELRVQLDDLKNQPAQVSDLARRLGLI